MYISEAGPQVFDAALSAKARNLTTENPARNAGRVIQSDPLLRCLLQLGLGRESILYGYSEEERSFRPYIEDGRISGYSAEVFNSLSATLIEYGNKTRQLRSFIEEIQASNSAFPALIALAGTFSTLLASLQARIADRKTPARSLLQLQFLFERPEQILALLIQISRKVDGAKTDEELLSRLYERVQDSEHTAAWLQLVTLNILASVSKPWLESVSGWLGLKASLALRPPAKSPRFARAKEALRKLDSSKEIREVEYEFEPLAMPSFVAKEDAQLMFETGQSLRLLEAHRPEHPLLRLTLANEVETPRLEWYFSWEHIEKIQAQAKEYESNLQKAIRDFGTHGKSARNINVFLDDTQPHDIDSTRLSEESAQAYIAASITTFEKPLLYENAKVVVSDSVLWSVHDVNETSEKEISAPPVSLLSALSFNPLISTQAHLVNRACLRVLFKDYSVRSHFSLLHRYSLFGDGVFASRLSQALFDPELQSSERRKGHSRTGTSGLKLGSRDTWPPASSELRLALMGILTESYYNMEQFEGSSIFRAELPGGLSFSIREMSEDELQRCMDPNSIEALDFLRLQYRPPLPLNAVITDGSLAKYDAVFKLLLRAVRMLFVVNQLSQGAKNSARRADFTSQQFRIESHHFVSAVCGYFFDGVQANWSMLEQRLNDIEKSLDREGADSLAELREFHEQILDRMMFTLILRKRQVQVMKLLEEIFSLVLQFARQSRSQIEGENSKAHIKEIYEKFAKKIRVFINVCRGLSERRGQGGTKAHETNHNLWENESKSEDEGKTISQLLLKFEMSGFYAR